jgi:hypothetical protein
MRTKYWVVLAAIVSVFGLNAGSAAQQPNAVAGPVLLAANRTPPCGPYPDIIDLQYAPGSMAELVDTSRFVADVTVQAIEPGVKHVWGDGFDIQHTDVLLQVNETVKGPALPSRIVVQAESWLTAPGRRGIVFLDHEYFDGELPRTPGLPVLHYPSRPETPRYSTAHGGVYGFCIQDGRIRMAPRELPEFRKEPVDVAPETVLAKIRKLVSAPHIRGRITMRGGAAVVFPSSSIPDNAPIRVVITSLDTTPSDEWLPSAPQAVLDWGSGRWGRIGSGGSFTLVAKAGAYKVSVEGLPEGFAVESIRFGATDGLKGPIQVSATTSDEIRIALRGPDSLTSISTVRGHVSSTLLAAVPANTWVSLTPEPRPEGRFIDGAAQVSSDGTFQFSRVTPGNYKMRVEIPEGALEGISWVAPSEQTVFVSPFDMDINLPLLTGALVTGRVATVGGGARLSDVFMGFGGILLPVSADGSFKALLPEGDYRLFVRPMGGPYAFTAFVADSIDPIKTIHADGVNPIGPITVVVGHRAPN